MFVLKGEASDRRAIRVDFLMALVFSPVFINSDLIITHLDNLAEEVILY